MSASSKTMTGALPPSSRWVRLRSARRRGGHLPAGPGRAGDRDELRHRVRDQGPAGVAVAADDVEHARRQELGRHLGQQQRRDRRGVRRLEHDGVAGGQGGRELPDRHHHRVVPRGHLGADADRLAPDVRGVAGHVLPGRPALEHPRGAGEEAELVDHRRDLLAGGQPAGLAGVAALGVEDSSAAGLDRVGDPQQRPLPLGRGRVPPALERVGRRASSRGRRRPEPETGAAAKTSPVLGSTRSAYPPSVGSTYAPSTKLRSTCLSPTSYPIQSVFRHDYPSSLAIFATDSVAGNPRATVSASIVLV